jgi:hypothetical protein
MTGLMRHNGCGSKSLQSWYDLQNMYPVDPLQIIENAILDSNEGSFEFSTNFIEPGAWATTPLSISNEPTVTALGTDNQQKNADANMWMFNHKRWNSSSALAIPLKRIIFLRGIHEWTNRIYIDFGSTPVTDVQLSLVMNAASRGDRQGTTPVIEWTGLGLMEEHTLNIVFREFGVFDVGLWTFDGANYSMFEMRWIVVP